MSPSRDWMFICQRVLQKDPRSYGPNVCAPPPSSYVEILTPKVMVLTGGVWGGDQVMRMEPSWMELVPLQKRPQRALWALLPCEDTVRSRRLWTGKWRLTRHSICWHFDLGLPSLRTVKNKFLLLISYPVYCNLLQQPELRHCVW